MRSDRLTIKDSPTVSLDDKNSALVIIDQTKLPHKVEFLSLTDLESIRDALYFLKVRGAPAIGVAAAIGLYLAAKKIPESSYDLFLQQFQQAKDYLASARPTAVNLFSSLNRMNQIVLSNHRKPVALIKEALRLEALLIIEEDVLACKAIGEHGLSLLKYGDGILTHCNAGQLAAVQYGTALAPLFLAHEHGLHPKVYACETRPLLQGARLTAYELQERGIDATLLCDSMASQVMKNGWIQAVFVGSDRIAANGDACNKIGTSTLAILAKHYGIPFYVF
ncbi:MAG: S-methyl-5-thioribose-1-phosphate isomerase, partial [Coriobacteriales bacterium]|nr:S-methyl-5-thioribose-1-phosphate isomerase [Coriobacteriales bacterium]